MIASKLNVTTSTSFATPVTSPKLIEWVSTRVINLARNRSERLTIRPKGGGRHHPKAAKLEQCHDHRLAESESGPVSSRVDDN